MPDHHTQIVIEALADALQTMAFVSLLPAEQNTSPASARCVSVAFGGPIRGRLELMADPALGALIASNILGTTPDDPQVALRSDDALKELANITCGVLLNHLHVSGESRFHMDVPNIQESRDAADWTHFLARPGAVTFDAEGIPVAVCLHREC